MNTVREDSSIFPYTSPFKYGVFLSENENLRPKTPWTKTKTLWTKTKTPWTETKTPWTEMKNPVD